MADNSLIDIRVSEPHDILGELRGEKNARRFKAYGDTFVARKPG